MKSTLPKAAPRSIPRRRVATRAQLLTAASAIFNETGTTNVSVEALCSRAGFTRGAFYSNFSTTDEVFLALFELQARDVQIRVENAVKQATSISPELDLKKSVRNILQALPLEKDWFILRATLLGQARRSTAVAESLNQQSESFLRSFEPLLVNAVHQLGRVPIVSSATLARAVIAAHLGGVSQTPIYSDAADITEASVMGVLLGLTEQERQEASWHLPMRPAGGRRPF